MTKKIIIDTDIGVDDAFALRYATKLFNVLGFTTVNGNCLVDQATKNAKLFCSKYGLDIPVYRGVDRPLSIEKTYPTGDVHGKDGLGECYDNPFDDQAPDAVRFIIDSVMANKNDITLVAIGPLTNIAAALSLRPEIAKYAKLVIMGGAYGFDKFTGNVTHFAEFNIYKDPHAADQVFQSGMDITVIPLDVTYKVIITRDDVNSTKDQFLIDISDFYIKFTLKEEGFEGMAVHDALTIAYMHDPSFFTTVKKPCRVLTSGLAIGQTVIPKSGMPIPDDCFKDMVPATICCDVDTKRVTKHLLETLAS